MPWRTLMKERENQLNNLNKLNMNTKHENTINQVLTNSLVGLGFRQAQKNSSTASLLFCDLNNRNDGPDECIRKHFLQTQPSAVVLDAKRTAKAKHRFVRTCKDSPWVVQQCMTVAYDRTVKHFLTLINTSRDNDSRTVVGALSC